MTPQPVTQLVLCHPQYKDGQRSARPPRTLVTGFRHSVGQQVSIVGNKWPALFDFVVLFGAWDLQGSGTFLVPQEPKSCGIVVNQNVVICVDPHVA